MENQTETPLKKINWIRIDTDFFDDERLRIIDKLPECDTILVIWVKLNIMAGKKNEKGFIYINATVPFSDEDLATIFNRPLNTVRLALDTFIRLQMIEIHENGVMYLPEFAGGQHLDELEKKREQARTRQQGWRDRKKLSQGLDDNEKYTSGRYGDSVHK